MSVLSMIYSFLFMPLQIIFEVVYSYACIILRNNYGLAIVALSLAINFLVLPLYNRADKIQEEERDTEARLSKGVSHIKKTFSGDERTMMLQTYYRQNNYSPLHALRSATSLFLEIPFFIAAYRFLSVLEVLNGTSFGPISNLGAQDALISVWGISINVLPILMTLLNVISTVIFTKNSSTKTKVQLYAMAAFFLVLLYNSPAGLVFYWTLNNLFSLVKTIFYKLKNPKKYLLILSSILGVCLIVFGVFFYIKYASLKTSVLLLFAGVALVLPEILTLIKKEHLPKPAVQPNHKLFLSCAVFLSLLTGVLIPSSVISASPQEFLNAGVFLHPIWYIIGATLIAAGMFIIWMGVFYRLFSDKAKIVFERLIAIICIWAIINYMFFGKNLGLITTNLKYDNAIIFKLNQKLINLLILFCVTIVVHLLLKRKSKLVRSVIIVSTIAVCVMSCINMAVILNSIAKVDKSQLEKKSDSVFSLSKTNKNVIVFMLDRAMGEYVPFIFDEYPELKEQFSGFTYYSNTISFGGHTNFAAPALFGGYEYTPVEINKRDTEPLVEKHNEALKVMPVLFNQNGFNVTVCDPPYAGYSEIPDLSIYDDYPEISTFITQGMFFDDDLKLDIISSRQRNFFFHSIFKIAPVLLQSTLYASGNYHQSNPVNTYSAYTVLKNLIPITTCSNTDKGNFIMFVNNTTHEHEIFSDLSYLKITPEHNNELFGTYLSVGNHKLMFNDYSQIYAYQHNIGALKRVGDWLDYLKSQNAYDNTRIVLVSDHGFAMNQIKDLFIDETATNKDADMSGDLEFYYPLLLVKDFDSHEFTISDEFMTNADVPTIATKDIIDHPINPFTKKKIDDTEKYAHNQYIIASQNWSVLENNGNTFLPARWYSVHDSIWDLNNWKLVTENAILP